MKLIIQIPCFNEAEQLPGTLADLPREIPGVDEVEWLIIDDGSTDATVEVARQCLARDTGAVSARLLRVERNRGKGYAVRAGLLAAHGRVSLFSDADLSTPIAETPKLVAPILAGECDVAFGSRALDRSLIAERQPWRREQSGRVFNRVVRLLTGLDFSDTQCGFKAFAADACRPVFRAATLDRFGFDVELLYVAQAAGLRLREVPVRWLHRDGSKVSILRDSLGMLGEVRAVRRRAAMGEYDSAINSVRDARRNTRGPAGTARDAAEEQPSEAAEVSLTAETARA